MTQLFSSRDDTMFRWVMISGVLLLGAGSGVAWSVWWSPYMTWQRVTIDQPVPFSHEHHVGGLGIDCRYCHTTVDVSSEAGMPSTETCMTCHSQIWTEAEALAPVRESWRTKVPIVWNRVHDLPDFTYFDHSIHVSKGVACATCHGPIETMPLTYRAETLYMKWCLDCHREPAHFVPTRAPMPNDSQLTDCSVCHR